MADKNAVTTNNTDLAVTNQTFALAEIPTIEEINDILENNIQEGMPFEVRQIDFPKPGTLFWQLVNDDGAKKPAEELKGIILDYHFYNVYYDEPYDGSRKPPTCISMDGITGVGNPGGSCKTCPLGGDDAWGTGTDEKGNPTDGKACANKLRFFPLLEGEAMPHQITLPPTNLTRDPGGFKYFINQLTNKFKAYQSVVVSLKLVEGKTKSGQESTKLLIGKIADLSKQEASDMIKYAKTLRPHLRNLKIEDDRDVEVVDVAGTVDGGGEDMESGGSWS